jgi:8-oxo-dGTP pyrophosphatase MutT (NUDIX family)
MARTRNVRAFSAGGVVYRRIPALEPSQWGSPEEQAVAQADPLAGVEIALVGRPHVDIWVLPKGTPRRGETVADAAVREVREETGLITRIVGEVGSIHYTFSREGTRFHKEVFHYLLEAVGGDTALHDAEYEDARWFPLAEAHRRLTFHNEADLLRTAEPLIARALAAESSVQPSSSRGPAGPDPALPRADPPHE